MYNTCIYIHLYTYIYLHRYYKYGKMLILGSSGGNTGVPYIVIIIIRIRRVLTLRQTMQ